MLKKFRTTVVKHFIQDNNPKTAQYDTFHSTSNQVQPAAAPQAPTLTIESNDETYTGTERLDELMAFAAKMVPKSKANQRYAASRKKEIDGLLNRGVFIAATLAEARGHRILKSRFVDHEKTRAHQKPSKSLDSLHPPPTTTFSSSRRTDSHTRFQRLLLSITASEEELTINNRDMYQPYTQAKTKLQRNVFIRPSKVTKLPAGLPLPESRLH